MITEGKKAIYVAFSSFGYATIGPNADTNILNSCTFDTHIIAYLQIQQTSYQ